MIIRRYGRRYFDAEGQRWTNLAELAEAIAKGETLEAVDPNTGEDVSALLLASILVWEAKQGRPRSPAGMHALLRQAPIRQRRRPRDRLEELFEQHKPARR